MASTTHAFDKGDIVTVFNRTMSGAMMIEGHARIARRLDEPNLYSVQFKVGETFDRTAYDRFVFPGDCQADPEAWLRGALAMEAA
jgi:hypothetical protein